jgi:hypothetical protein
MQYWDRCSSALIAAPRHRTQPGSRVRWAVQLLAVPPGNDKSVSARHYDDGPTPNPETHPDPTPQAKFRDAPKTARRPQQRTAATHRSSAPQQHAARAAAQHTHAHICYRTGRGRPARSRVTVAGRSGADRRILPVYRIAYSALIALLPIAYAYCALRRILQHLLICCL